MGKASAADHKPVSQRNDGRRGAHRTSPQAAVAKGLMSAGSASRSEAPPQIGGIRVPV